jgi:O-antigen/teichoic acid export membrane protein
VQKKFLKDVSGVFSGTLLAQLIPIAGTFALARIYTPSSFGQYSVWLGCVLFLSTVMTCRFEMSLPMEEDGNPRRVAVVFTMVTIALMSSIAIALFWLLVTTKLSPISKLPAILIIIVIPASAFQAAVQTMQNWAAADGRYKHLSIIRIAQASSIVLIQIIIGLKNSNSSYLGIGYLSGALISLCICIMVMPIHDVSVQNLTAQLIAFWSRHRRFPIYSLPADSVSAATAQLPIIIVASRFGEETAGFLSMSLRMVGAPMGLLSLSVLDVFKRHAAQAYRERRECTAEYIHSFKMLCIISFLSSLSIVLFGKEVFSVIVGTSWINAASMSIILLPRFALGFIASPLSYMVYIVGKQQIDLIWQLALLVMCISTLLIPKNSNSALMIYSISYALLYIIYIHMSYNYSRGEK